MCMLKCKNTFRNTSYEPFSMLQIVKNPFKYHTSLLGDGLHLQGSQKPLGQNLLNINLRIHIQGFVDVVNDHTLD